MTDGIRIGAHSLGLRPAWRYAFVPAGSRCSSTPDAIFLDTGGEVSSGVLDTHGWTGSAPCTAQLVLTHPELVYDHLMYPSRTRRQHGSTASQPWSPVIVTHHQPDFDAVVSTLLVELLVEGGDLPGWAASLAAYAAIVDRGAWRVDKTDERTWRHPVHMAFLVLQHIPIPGSKRDGDLHRLSRGLRLLRSEIAAILGDDLRASRTHFLDLDRSGLGAWRSDPEFRDLAIELDRDHARFMDDLTHARVTHVNLPAEDGGADLNVPTLILERPPTSMLAKYWVRESGYPYFLCPMKSHGAGAPDHYARTILSLDPNWSVDGRKPTLRGLGCIVAPFLGEMCARRYRAGTMALATTPHPGTTVAAMISRLSTPHSPTGPCFPGRRSYASRPVASGALRPRRCSSCCRIPPLVAVEVAGNRPRRSFR